uniref:BZIP domain-containing protein n=1 Tax=Globisporangium ultimum (strain ATCC 200006 / CBS 805.95 / DAOM BR144) TaxID=431595 RepID=K3WNT6_GLOUD
MEWSARSPSRFLPLSILLNPEDGNAVTAFGSDTSPCASSGHTSEDASGSGSDTRAVEATTAVLVVTTKPPPKRRGRKAHLPKMNNSERGKYYRNKRKRYGDELMSSVAAVREEIVRLHAMKAICNDLSISTHMSLPGSFGRIVREFFVQFRHGVQLSPARRNMALPDVEISTCQQELYMNATMARDVDFGEFQGIDTIMDQWQRYSQYHSLLVFEMLDMHITGPKSAPIVSANGRLRARYSRKTIENVFPHVVGNEPLIQRLIGKEIVYPCSNQFFFSEDGRIQRYNTEADFVFAMVQALGSTEDAALLLGQALIQKQHMIGVGH